jgi:putative membrane protein
MTEKALFRGRCVKKFGENAMSVLSMVLNGLIVVIALMHIGFMVLEMALWTKPVGLKIFGQSLENAQLSAKLAANQGLYNGFLAAGLIWGIFFGTNEVETLHIVNFFLSCILLAGLFGGFTVSRRIWLIQALPAVLALAIIHFA